MSVAPAPVPIASADEGQRRRRLRMPRHGLVVAIVAACVMALGVPSVAFASHSETQIMDACAQKSNGLLRVASGTDDCRPKQETPVTIWPGPTTLCIQPDGSVRRYTSAKSCTGAKPAGTVLVVPTTNGQPVYFCAPSSGVLRRVSASTACLSTEQRYVIGNHAPSALTLSNDSLLENEPAGTIVGTLGLVDEDPAATPAFALVSGAGSTDNAAFTITGTTLKTATSFDFETKTSYSIRVRGTDGYGGGLEQVFTISVLDVVEDVPPTAVADTATVDEDAAPTTVDVLVNDEDVDGGPISISGVGQPDHGTVVVAGDEASVTYEPDDGYCNAPPGTTTDEFTYTLAPGGSTTTVGVKVTCVDDLPVAADDEATVDEDAAATAIDVLANDADSDGGPRSITSVVQPEHGTVVITGGGTGLTYQPDAGYCNAPPGDANDLFSYTLSPGDANAQVSVKVICIADAPVADDETFDGASAAVGNTLLVIDDPTDGALDPLRPHLLVAGNLLDGDTDADPGTELAIESGVTVTEQGGVVYLEADGDFAYLPPDGCTATTDGFDYTVTDQGAVNAMTDIGHVTIAISGCVWYVDNAADGNDGNVSRPFDTIAQAVAASSAGDDIFVFDGDGTTTGYSTAIALDDDQQLIGEASDLVVGGRTLHQGDPAKRPTITASAGTYVVSLGVGNRVAGLEVHPVTAGGGIGVVDPAGDPAGDVTIDDVRIVDTVAGGIGLALQDATGANMVGDLEVDVIGLGVLVNDTAKIVFDPAATVKIRTTGTGWAFLSQRSNLEGSQIDQIVVDDAFDGGINLQQTTGAITFGDLDIRTLNSTQAAFTLSLTGPVTVPANATAKIVATNGPAVSVVASSGSSLSFDEVTSTKSSVYGINIDQIGAGTFSAAAGELSAGPFGLTPFRVRGGSGDISYGGSITDGPATTSVDIQSRTGGTVTLSGSITDGSDEGGGIIVANNTGGATVLSGATKQFSTNGADVVVFTSSDGHALSLTGGGLDIDTSHGKGLFATSSGTLAVTGAGNTIDTSVGFAVTIAFTDIAAAGVTFQRVSIGGTGNIVVNGTGTAGSFNITGLGNTTQGGDGSGGLLKNSQGFAVSLMDTKSPSLRNMRIVDPDYVGVIGSRVDGFSFTYGTISGAGTPNIDGSSAIRFGGGSGADLTGAVAITDNVITGTEENGISIANGAGTISHADISRNRISDDGTTTTPGYAIGLSAGGTATTVASITKATIQGNAITDFRRGGGISVRGGNTVAGGPAGILGIQGSATAVISVTGNSMDGGSGGVDAQPIAFFDGVVQGAGQGNFDVSGNGTAAAPLRHFDGTVIDLLGLRQATLTTRVAGNFIDAGNGFGWAGISVVSDSDTDQPGSGVHSTLVTGNTIRGTDGPGIITRIVNSNGSLTAQILNNTITAPTTTSAAVAGIRVDSGSAVGLPTLCLEITGNTTAGSTNVGTGATSPGIALRRQNVVGVTFGIEGLSPVPAGTPVVENYMNGQNTSASGTLGTGGTTLLGSSGFTSCTAP